MFISSYGVVAIVVVLGAAWLAAMVFYNTHSVITIVSKDLDGYRIWRHKETKVELGTAHGDSESIRVSAGGQFNILPPGEWDAAEKKFMKMIHALVLRRKVSKRLVWIADKHLPKEVTDWYHETRRRTRSWA